MRRCRENIGKNSYLRTLVKRYPTLFQKALYTLIILLIYQIGRSLPLYGVDIDYYAKQVDTVESLLMQTVSGSKYYNTVFSLGISPYMMSMLLVQIIAACRSEDAKKRTSPKALNIITIYMTGIFAVIEAFIRTANLKFRYSQEMVPLCRFIAITELVTGVMIIMVLCSRNKTYGIGGQMLLILINIIDGFTSTLAKHEKSELIIPFVIMLIIGLLTIVLENAELRIPVHRISIYNIYHDKNYIAFKLNPVGAMPIMFAAVFFLIPQFGSLLLLLLFPQNETLQFIQENMTLNMPLGMKVYIFIIFFTTIVFSLIFISPKDMAEALMKGGDTILSLRAGKQTRRYLSIRLIFIAFFSACFMSLCVGIPMLLQLKGKLDSSMTMIPMTAMALVSISCNFIRDAKSIRDLDCYRPFL